MGSFTRLTKVKAAEFRKLLSEEQRQMEPKREINIKSTRLPIRRTTADFYNEYSSPNLLTLSQCLHNLPL